MLHKGLYSILASGPAKRNGKLYAAQEATLCIELKQVTKEYGHATVLKNITLTLEEPGLYCLLGRNGAGKTTLCRYMVDSRFWQEELEETALEHILRG